MFLITKMPGLIVLKVKTFLSYGASNSCGVLIAYLGCLSKSFVIKNKGIDGTGPILILDLTTDDTDYILVNICSANTETEQIKILNNRIISTFFSRV